jgi:hypothetical protein
MNSGEPLDEDDFRALLKLADANHDGLINYSGKLSASIFLENKLFLSTL